MPRITTFQPTPNPNALKCILDAPLAGPVRSFRSAAEASADQLAGALFAIPGVTSVLISGGWLTVNKAPDMDWPKIKRAVEEVVKSS